MAEHLPADAVPGMGHDPQRSGGQPRQLMTVLGGGVSCPSPCLPQVISTARTCNLIFIVLDCLKPMTHKKLIEKELEGFGIRLNKKPPAISFRKKEKGGINFTSTIPNPSLDLEGAPIAVFPFSF